MGCSSCGKRAVQYGAQSRSLTRMGMSRMGLVSGRETWPSVTYYGPASNHYVASPTKKVKNYGYRSRGSILQVHPDDVKAKPDLFRPSLLMEAQKVYPNYPSDAPEATVGLWAIPQEEVA
jgi:hypothetical protein